MPKINYPQVQAIVDHFEGLVTACEEYRDFLESKRPAAYRGRAATGGARRHGRFMHDPLTSPPPPPGAPEFKEFGINRMVVKGIGNTQDLLDVLEGEVYDRLRVVVDGLGTLESALKGEWA